VVSKAASDKSVRDHRQQARLSGDQIVVASYVGPWKAGEFRFPLSEWHRAESTRDSFNPAWNKRELIRCKTLEMDEQRNMLVKML
jgi:hypothetical protein